MDRGDPERGQEEDQSRVVGHRRRHIIELRLSRFKGENMITMSGGIRKCHASSCSHPTTSCPRYLQWFSSSHTYAIFTSDAPYRPVTMSATSATCRSQIRSHAVVLLSTVDRRRSSAKFPCTALDRPLEITGDRYLCARKYGCFQEAKSASPRGGAHRSIIQRTHHLIA